MSNQIIPIGVESLDKYIDSLSFLAGFFWSTTATKVIQYPFSQTLQGVCGGFVAQFCASFVKDMIPANIKSIFAVLLLFSAFYYATNPPCLKCNNPHQQCNCTNPE